LIAYRADIDGLRAVAVLAVLAFHALPQVFPGGFVGVDIFFVISGYLISLILFSSLQHQQFSLLNFYSRRIRRIFPALITVFIASLVMGWFFFYADEFNNLGRHMISSAAFIQNWILASESGYFDSSAEIKPFLHLWSLGVEEQFYIIWPLLLWCAWKLHIHLFKLTIACLLASFAWNLYEFYVAQSTVAFYLPQVRFWELLIGSALAYSHLNFSSPSFSSSNFSRLGVLLGSVSENVRSISGAALLLLSFFFINSQRVFPGFWALLPTLGAALIISAGPKATLNNLFLSNKLAVWIGRISYPLYLWHWVLLVYLRILEPDLFAKAKFRIAALALAVLLSWLTYRLIEKPLRFGNYAKLKTLGLLVAMIGIIFIGREIQIQSGMGYRFTTSAAYLGGEFQAQMRKNLEGDYQQNTAACDFYQPEKKTNQPKVDIAKICYEADSKKQSVFLWGDSHAQMLSYGIKNHLPTDWQLLQVASVGCKPNPTQLQDSNSNYCERSNYRAIELIKKIHPQTVVLAQSTAWQPSEIETLSASLRKYGVHRIVFIGQSPEWSDALPTLMMRKQVVGIPRYSKSGLVSETLAINERTKQIFTSPAADVTFVDLIDLFCNADGCLVYIGDDPVSGITYFDSHHLSPVASDHLAKNKLVKAIIGK
jgi:peptidoglycan/LPS O-acetylase OafA/YrhL